MNRDVIGKATDIFIAGGGHLYFPAGNFQIHRQAGIEGGDNIGLADVAQGDDD